MTLIAADSLGRSLFSPKDLGITAGIPQLKKLYEGNLQFNTESGRQESVNCLRLFGDQPVLKCHDVGLAKQKSDNEKLLANAQNTGKEPPLRTYIGYCEANHGEISAISVSIPDASSSETIKFTVENVPEQNNEAHCNITMVISSEVNGFKKFFPAAKQKLSQCFDGNFVSFSIRAINPVV